MARTASRRSLSVSSIICFGVVGSDIGGQPRPGLVLGGRSEGVPTVVRFAAPRCCDFQVISKPGLFAQFDARSVCHVLGFPRLSAPLQFLNAGLRAFWSRFARRTPADVLFDFLHSLVDVDGQCSVPCPATDLATVLLMDPLVFLGAFIPLVGAPSSVYVVWCSSRSARMLFVGRYGCFTVPFQFIKHRG